MKNSPAANMRIIFALTLVHFTGDLYSSFISPLFPAFVAKLGLTLTQVGVVAGVNRFLAFIVQPTVGYFADRYQSRVFALGGMLIAVVFVPLAGVAPSFWPLLVFVALGSMGSSMFHPSVTGMVPLYAGWRTSFCMSIFNTGGTLAFAVGPIFITAFVAAFGLEAVPGTTLLGLMVFGLLYRILPSPSSEGLRDLGFWLALRDSLGSVWRVVVLIWLVMVMRAVVGQAFLTFMPVLCVQEGYSLVSAGTWLALFTAAGAISGLLAGWAADRIGYRPIFLATHILMTPALLWLLACRGPWLFTGAFAAGFMVLASLPLGIAMAQQLAPRGRAMVSSLMMGLAFGLGGTLAPLVGHLGDAFGLRPALTAVAYLPLLSVVPIFFFPSLKPSDQR